MHIFNHVYTSKRDSYRAYWELFKVNMKWKIQKQFYLLVLEASLQVEGFFQNHI